MAGIHTLARAVGRSAIPLLQKAGYTATAGLRLLMTQGYGYRWSDYFGDWREYRQTKERERFFRRMPLDRKPPVGLMVKKASPVGGKYTYRFRALMRDTTTGRERYEWKSVSIDERITPQEAQERLVHNIDRADYERYEEYVRGTLRTVLRR